MKKTTYSKMVGISLATSLIVASSITVQAVTNSIKGDLNSDGFIDSKDLAVLKTNILLGSKNTTYDVNADTKINIFDYVALSKMFVHTPLTDNTNITSAFTDVNFKNAVYALIGKNGPVPILYSDVKNLKNLNISSKSISSLSGIQYFTSLTSLYCGFNQLTSLDVSKNIALTTLSCASNKLTTLAVSKNTALTYLDVSSNGILVLDVSKNIGLNYLNCYSNKLTGLDIIDNSKLAYLSCASNQLPILDVSKNTALTYLNCSDNQIADLDASNNNKLTYLNCSKNQLTTLAVSKNTALTDLNCSDNQIADLDASNNTKLTYLNCSKNQLTTLDVSNNIALTTLACSYNQLTSFYSFKKWDTSCYKVQYTDSTQSTVTTVYITIKLSGDTDITSYFTDKNFKAYVYDALSKPISDKIYYSELNGRNYIDVTSKKISSLNGIEYYTSLTSLECSGNQITDLDVSTNTALTSLNCFDNQLTNLDVSKNTDLTYLDCSKNKLVTLDISNNILLSNFNCSNNQLISLYSFKKWYTDYYKTQYTDSTQSTVTTVYITIKLPEDTDITSYFTDENFKAYVYDTLNRNSSDPILYSDLAGRNYIDLPSNENISSLNGIEYCTSLASLDCSGNQITDLDVSNNTQLTDLNCSSNQITDLDVSNNTALTYLNCSNNQITNLDASNNTQLTNLNCAGNQITDLDVSNNTQLTDLNCSENQLITLDVSKNNVLSYLDCRNNELKTLCFSKDAFRNADYNPQYADSNRVDTTNIEITTK